MNPPKEAKHLNENIIYNGCGPRKSLDQRITFINENNNLAQRIMKVGRRPQVYGKVQDEKLNQFTSTASIMSRKNSVMKLGETD